MVRMLEGMGGEDGRYQSSRRPSARRSTLALDPDCDVDGHVEEEAKEPMCKPHSALAGRGVDIRLEHSAQTLKQHERPHDLQLGSGVPQAQVPSPEQRAGYRGNVKVGEVVVRDLDCGGIVEQAVNGRLLCEGLLCSAW